MFRRNARYNWDIHTGDGEGGLICKEIWDEMFPHLRFRRRMTLSVYTSPVKGSRKFSIYGTGWLGGIKNQGLLYYQMERLIANVLNSQDRDKMDVWVTFT